MNVCRKERALARAKEQNEARVQGRRWVPCLMLEYDADSQTYLVSYPDSGSQAWVPRLELCFDAENPVRPCETHTRTQIREPVC